MGDAKVDRRLWERLLLITTKCASNEWIDGQSISLAFNCFLVLHKQRPAAMIEWFNDYSAGRDMVAKEVEKMGLMLLPVAAVINKEHHRDLIIPVSEQKVCQKQLDLDGKSDENRTTAVANILGCIASSDELGGRCFPTGVFKIENPVFHVGSFGCRISANNQVFYAESWKFTNPTRMTEITKRAHHFHQLAQQIDKNLVVTSHFWSRTETRS